MTSSVSIRVNQHFKWLKGWTTNVVAAIVLAIAVKFGGGWFMTWTFFGSVINIFQLETFNFGIKKDLVDFWPIF